MSAWLDRPLSRRSIVGMYEIRSARRIERGDDWRMLSMLLVERLNVVREQMGGLGVRKGDKGSISLESRTVTMSIWKFLRLKIQCNRARLL